jgi:hypothetical protein
VTRIERRGIEDRIWFAAGQDAKAKKASPTKPPAKGKSAVSCFARPETAAKHTIKGELLAPFATGPDRCWSPITRMVVVDHLPRLRDSGAPTPHNRTTPSSPLTRQPDMEHTPVALLCRRHNQTRFPSCLGFWFSVSGFGFRVSVVADTRKWDATLSPLLPSLSQRNGRARSWSSSRRFLASTATLTLAPRSCTTQTSHFRGVCTENSTSTSGGASLLCGSCGC